MVAVSPSSKINRIERLLLVCGGTFLLLGLVALLMIRQASFSHWLILPIWCVSAVIGNYTLQQRLPNRDPLLFPLAMFLSGWGLLLITRLAPNFGDRQTLWLLVSVVALVVVVRVPQMLRWLRHYRYLLLLAGLLLLVSTILFGRNPSGFGPQLWLGFNTIFFQPSEALKIILVAFLASYLGEQYTLLQTQESQPKRIQWTLPRILGPMSLMWGLSIVLLVWQRDLGTATLFFMVFMILLYAASGRFRIVLTGIFLILAAGLTAYFLFDVVQLRIDIWINPWADADGRAFQIVQSLMAFASGGIFGEGFAQGSPIYIPVVHSDFVFAALAEEWGLLGVIVVIACFAVLVMRGLRVAINHEGAAFYPLLAIGLSVLLGIQALLIMGGVLKLLPLTGVTLPFLSYGGSSLVMSFTLIGLLLKLSAGKT